MPNLESVDWTIVFSITFFAAALVIIGALVRNAGGSKGNLLNAFFRSVSDTVNGAETAALDFFSVLVPYFVPIIPAYLTYRHTREQMGFDLWVAWTAAFVVEVLGTASVATAIRFYRWNQRYKDVKKKAPFWLAVIVYAVYIIITITVNVILEIVAGKNNGWVILAIALFSLLSFPSSVLVSIRTQFHEMLDDLKPGKKSQDTGGDEVVTINQDTPAPELKEKHASDYRGQIVKMFEKEYRKTGKILPLREISKRLKLDHDKSKGSISAIRNQWMAENGIPKPSKE